MLKVNDGSLNVALSKGTDFFHLVVNRCYMC